jgi:hypothetical protein
MVGGGGGGGAKGLKFKGQTRRSGLFKLPGPSRPPPLPAAVVRTSSGTSTRALLNARQRTQTALH